MKEQDKKDRARGVVQYGTAQIAYTCRGVGQATLLLCVGDAAPELVFALASRFRVIAPTLPPVRCDLDFAAWLSILADGLGLTHPRVVLVGQAAVLASVTQNDTDRFERIELISSKPHREEIKALIERLSR